MTPSSRLCVSSTEELLVLLVPAAESAVRRLADALSGDSSPRFLVEGCLRLDDALGRIDRKGVDVVLLDLTDSRDPGPEAIIPIHAHGPEIPVVVVTGDGGDGAISAAALRAGAVDQVSPAHMENHLIGHCLRHAIDRQRLLLELRTRTLVDELTGLHNRRGLLALAPECRRLAHRQQKPLLLFLAAMEGALSTGSVEERHRLLRSATEALRDTFRASDVIARIDEDLFAVLALVDATEVADRIVVRLRRRITETRTAGNPPPTLRVSVTPIDSAGPVDFEEFLARAARPAGREKKVRTE